MRFYDFTLIFFWGDDFMMTISYACEEIVGRG